MVNLEAAILPIRGVQAIFNIIIFGFTVYVASWWNKYWRDMSPSEINFLLFTSVYSVLSLVYLTATALPNMKASRFNNHWATLILDSVNVLFWFAGFIALAVFLGSRVCFGTVCGVARATVAFSVFQWLLFSATTIWITMLTFRASRAHAQPQAKEFHPEQQHVPVQMQKQSPNPGVDPTV